MGFRIQFLIILVSLIAGLVAIFLANRLMKKYPLPYLASYFYYLIFLYIFSVYSIIGSQAMSIIMENHETPLLTIQSTEAVLIAMGIPFLILSWFMFLRMSREFYRSDLPRYFAIVYFSLFGFSFISYALLNLDIGGLEAIQFFMDYTQLLWIFTVLTIMVYGYSISEIYLRSSSIKDKQQRLAFRWFALWYTIIVLLSLVSLHLSTVHILFGLLFIVVLTGFHTIPVLFLSLYLQKFYVERVEAPNFKEKLGVLIDQYEISKREAEIVELICKGMSNQEISDSLFISLQTVKDHVHRIFLKTGVKNRVQLNNLVGGPEN